VKSLEPTYILATNLNSSHKWIRIVRTIQCDGN